MMFHRVAAVLASAVILAGGVAIAPSASAEVGARLETSVTVGAGTTAQTGQTVGFLGRTDSDGDATVQDARLRFEFVGLEPGQNGAISFDVINCRGFQNTIPETMYSVTCFVGDLPPGAFAQHLVDVRFDDPGAYHTVIRGFAFVGAGDHSVTHDLTVEVPVDTTAPAITCDASPAVSTKRNHSLLPVVINVDAFDSGSGLANVELAGFISSQFDSGMGSGDKSDDMQGWIVNTDDREGLIRAERYDTDRVYTWIYRASDHAGNNALCFATTRIVLKTKTRS